MSDDSARAERARFEDAAETLVVFQLDLLAQIEAQLRAAHHTMRRIEKLRGSGNRRDSEPVSNGERQEALVGLSAELVELDQQIAAELQCTKQMEDTITRMQRSLQELRRGDPQVHKTSGRSQRRRRQPRGAAEAG